MSVKVKKLRSATSSKKKFVNIGIVFQNILTQILLNVVVNIISMITATSLFFIKLIIWPSLAVKLVNAIKALVKKTVKILHSFAMAFLNFSSFFEKPKYM